jgi:hypothetical protein
MGGGGGSWGFLRIDGSRMLLGAAFAGPVTSSVEEPQPLLKAPKVRTAATIKSRQHIGCSFAGNKDSHQIACEVSPNSFVVTAFMRFSVFHR